MMTRLIALLEPGLDRRRVADAAAELDRDPHRLENPLDRRRVHRLAGKGAVEIDDVEILEALALEGMRLRRGIAVKHRGARHVALLEPHADAVLEVDGGKKDHGRPLQEIGDQLEAQPLALLRVELRADHGVAPDHGGDRAAVVGLGHQIGALVGLEMERVHEIGVQALRPDRDAVEQRMRPARVERVPAHVGNFQARVGRRDAIDLARRSSRAPRSPRIRGRARP